MLLNVFQTIREMHRVRRSRYTYAFLAGNDDMAFSLFGGERCR